MDLKIKYYKNNILYVLGCNRIFPLSGIRNYLISKVTSTPSWTFFLSYFIFNAFLVWVKVCRQEMKMSARVTSCSKLPWVKSYLLWHQRCVHQDLWWQVVDSLKLSDPFFNWLRQTKVLFCSLEISQVPTKISGLSKAMKRSCWTVCRSKSVCMKNAIGGTLGDFKVWMAKNTSSLE